MDKSTLLSYYKRKDIQNEIIANAKNREIAVRFSDIGFGERPDILQYPSDIIELAKQGATSFHASEEIWKNPLRLSADMKKKELEDLRTGWDLVIDIDSKIWNLSRIAAWLIIKSLKEHGISSVSVKFSGNKGFHIGVPFEAFPEKISDTITKTQFPDYPKLIAQYILNYIAEKHTKVESKFIIFGKRFKINIDKLIKATKDTKLTYWYCNNCKKKVEKKKEEKQEIILDSSDIDFINDPSYKSKVKKSTFRDKVKCCNNPQHIKRFDISSIIDIDTLLISSRHLYRMPYSLHEKSGLASIPFNPDKILNFKKEHALPSKVKVLKHRFLDKRNVKKEALNLLKKSLAFRPPEDQQPIMKKEFTQIKAALPEHLFPPCIKRILKGLEDGRKRSLFILLNFLTSVGWNYADIETLLKEWNKKNNEPLRETYLLSHLKYHKARKKKILPANCSNNMYYKDIRVCIPDNLCNKIKNPVNYAIRKGRYIKKQ